MRVFLAVLVMLGGCSDSGGAGVDAMVSNDGLPPDGTSQSDGPWIDGTTPGKGTPQNCDADKYFCYGSQMRHCTASGKDSVLVTDCADLDIAGVLAYTCTGCPGVGYGVICEADKPTTTGTASGLVSFSYAYKPGCSPKAIAYVSMTSGLSHSAYPNGTGSYPGIIVTAADISQIPSGAPVALNPPAGSPKPVTVILNKAKGLTCSNLYSGATSPGTVTITHQGATKGSTVTIKINGDLTCDGTTWEAFTYNASGILQ